MGHFVDLRFADPIFFADLKLPQIHKALLKICRAKKGLNGSSFCSMVKKFADLPLPDSHTLVICRFIKKICGFAICGRAILRNLRISNSGMIQRICGFAICSSNKKVSVPTFGRQSPQTGPLKPTFFFWAFH